MRNDRLAKVASIVAVLIAMLTPNAASAGGHPPAGHVAPIPLASVAPHPLASPFTGIGAFPMCSSCCYTFPIQAVYQCPAVIAGQPGAQVIYLRSDSPAGVLGGQPFLYHY